MTGSGAALTRARVVAIIGVVAVPAAAYGLPHVSPYAAVIIGAVLAMVMVWIKPGSAVRELGLNVPPRLWRTVLVGVAAGVGLLLMSRLVLTPLIELITGVRRDLGAFDSLRGNARAVIALLPAIWLSAGICEEVVYRGYLIPQGAMLLGNSRAARLAALVFAALLFALAHWYQGLTGMLLTGAIAILLGLLFLQQRQNLWANMIAHITGDTLSLVLIYSSSDRWLNALARSLLTGH